jgi:hypothetical protein
MRAFRIAEFIYITKRARSSTFQFHCTIHSACLAMRDDMMDGYFHYSVIPHLFHRLGKVIFPLNELLAEDIPQNIIRDATQDKFCIAFRKGDGQIFNEDIFRRVAALTTGYQSCHLSCTSLYSIPLNPYPIPEIDSIISKPPGQRIDWQIQLSSNTREAFFSFLHVSFISLSERSLPRTLFTHDKIQHGYALYAPER